MFSMKRIPSRTACFALLAVGAVCLTAACGSSTSSGSGAAASTASTSTVASASGSGAAGFSARRAALVACLRQHGVHVPSRPPGASGGSGTTTGPRPGDGFFGGGGGFFRQAASNPKVQAALKACGANFRFGAGHRFRISHQAVEKYVACVHQHGYNLPAPNFSGKGSVFPASIRSDPKFLAASRQCQSLLVPPRPASSSSGGASAGA